MERLVKLSGSAPLGPLFFRSASIQESLGEHTRVQVTFESDEASLDAEAYLGQTICLGFETREGEFRYIDGVVDAFEHSAQARAGRCEYRVDLRSWTSLLSKNLEYRTYQNLTVQEIATEVIGRHGHPAVRFEDRTHTKSPAREYCIQFGESDFHFIRRLFEEEGIYTYFEHKDGQHLWVWADNAAVHQVFQTYDCLRLAPSPGASRLQEHEYLDALAKRKAIAPPRFAHSDYFFKTPTTDLNTKTSLSAAGYNAPYEQFEYPGEYTEVGQGQAYSQRRAEENLCLQEVFVGSTAARGICTGYRITTECDTNASLNQDLLVISSTLFLEEAPPESAGGPVSSFGCEFEAIALSQPFRLQRATRKPVVRGPLPALVVGPSGQEIFTDEFGRVKLQFYWDRYGERNEESSCWVRVAFPVAGKGWGFVAIPRIGQEVVVSFEDGDPDRPLITGVVYNAEQHVPYPLPAQKTVSGWRSHSTMGGAASNFNELRFEDKKGDEYIWFQAEKDLLWLVKNNIHQEVMNDIHQWVGGAVYEEIQKDVSRKILGDLREEIEKSLHLQIKQDLLAQVNGMLSVRNSGEATLHTTGKLSAKSGGPCDIQSGADLNLSSGAATHLKAGVSVQLSASSSISLGVGASSIVITPSNITINSPSVTMGKGGSSPSASPAQPTATRDASPALPVEKPEDPIG